MILRTFVGLPSALGRRPLYAGFGIRP
jgi:hypothetical protein